MGVYHEHLPHLCATLDYTTAGVIHVNCRWNYSFFNQLLGVNYVLRVLWQTVLIPWTIHPPCSPNSSKIESGRETAIGTGNAQHIGRVSTHRKASLWAAKLKRWGWTGASHGGGKRRSPHRSRWLQAHVSHVNAKPQITAFSAGGPGSVPGSERSPEKGMAIHSSILAWRTPWTEESRGSKRVGTQLSN